MAVYQIDVQMSVPEPFGLSGRYYWTWLYYVLADTDSEASSRALAQTANQAKNISSSTLHYHGYQITSPPRSGHVTRAYVPLDQPCLRPTGNLIPIHNVMRQRMWSGGKQVGYRLWRGGFLDTDVDGAEFTTAAVSWAEGVAGILVLSGYVCSLHGLVIDNITCDSRIAMANLRHGTKRRARKVLT